MLPNGRLVRYDVACPALGAGKENMQPYRVLEHTADVGFEAFGGTREEVFANAARGLTDLMVDLDSIAPRDSTTLGIEGSDAPALLVNWLSEILYLWETEQQLFREYEIGHLSDRHIKAVARGERFDPARHRLKLLVKAITYHQLSLGRIADGWHACVYVDI